MAENSTKIKLLKEFDFLVHKCFPTDDSIMTLAIAQAILDCNGDETRLAKHAIRRMQELGREYPHAGYGGRFGRWLTDRNIIHLSGRVFIVYPLTKTLLYSRII